MRYMFSMVIYDPTTQTLPYWEMVEADTAEHAITMFAQKHGLIIDWHSTGDGKAWFTTVDGKEVEYHVSSLDDKIRRGMSSQT